MGAHYIFIEKEQNNLKTLLQFCITRKPLIEINYKHRICWEVTMDNTPKRNEKS